jgi:hypothetical protein
MAGDHCGEPPARQQAQASGDAYIAGRDVIINQAVPLAPSSEVTPPERVWVNVPARNPGFTGRDGLLSEWRSSLGPGHEDTLAAAMALGDALRGLGHFAQAREMDQDTLARCLRVLGEDHPSTLRSAGNLVGDLYELGEYEPARVLGEEVLARRRAILGERHPETLASARQLDRLLAVTGGPGAVRGP